MENTTDVVQNVDEKRKFVALKSPYFEILTFICLIVVLISFSFVFPRTSFGIRRIPLEILNQQMNETLKTIKCIVAVRQSDGRLGNRLFMIATAYGLARLYSCHLHLSSQVLHDVQKLFLLDFSLVGFLPTPIFDIFLLKNHSKSMLLTRKYVTCQYLKELSRPNAIKTNEIYELIGFWQSYLHFLNYRNEILEKVFFPLPKFLKNVSKFFAEICKKRFQIETEFSFKNYSQLKNELINFKQTTWIGIHIRRKDFLGLGYSSNDNYLLNATTFFLRQYPNAFFIVASDDKTYAEKLFDRRENFVVTPSSFSIDEDFMSLILCEHSIVTGGTFGWWTAFLTNGRVTYDLVYPSGCDRREHFYPPWFLLDGNVRAHKNSNYTN